MTWFIFPWESGNWSDSNNYRKKSRKKCAFFRYVGGSEVYWSYCSYKIENRHLTQKICKLYVYVKKSYFFRTSKQYPLPLLCTGNNVWRYLGNPAMSLKAFVVVEAETSTPLLNTTPFNSPRKKIVDLYWILVLVLPEVSFTHTKYLQGINQITCHIIE